VLTRIWAIDPTGTRSVHPSAWCSALAASIAVCDDAGRVPLQERSPPGLWHRFDRATEAEHRHAQAAQFDPDVPTVGYFVHGSAPIV
jgi:hypothetical protein